MIGETMFVSGLAMFLTAPIAGRLMPYVDKRLMLMAGFLFVAVGTWWMTWITSDWDFYELLWPQTFRGIGLMLSIIPINDISLGTLPPERVKNASGLFNLMRNLGGAFGLAGLQTAINDRMDLHLARLHEQITWSRLPAMEALTAMTNKFSAYGTDAQAMALKAMYGMAHKQGVVLAFSDTFLLLTMLFAGLALAALLVRQPRAAAAPAH
jgi:MFS transporter, DHA2 family, multidrug resistance protein